MRRRNKRMRIGVIIISIIVVAALVVTYVMMFPINSYGETIYTPPPEDYGTSGDYDDSTLTFPGDEEEEDLLEPMLMITGGPIRLDVGQTYAIPFLMTDFPSGTMAEWESKNPAIAVVSSDGVIYAVSPGDVEIAVRAGDKRSSVLVTVNELKANRIIIVVDDEIIKTGSNSYEVSVGDVTRFTAKIEPEGAKVDKIVWVLGNGNVASLSQNGEFVAEAIGATQVTLTAGSLVDAITINIVESGVPLATIWDYLKYGVIILIIVIVIIVLIVILASRRKKEKARMRAMAARRRKEEAERRAREEAAAYEMRREPQEPRPPQSESRETMKVSGTAVGAGMNPPVDRKTDLERPLTLDDLE